MASPRGSGDQLALQQWLFFTRQTRPLDWPARHRRAEVGIARHHPGEESNRRANLHRQLARVGRGRYQPFTPVWAAVHISRDGGPVGGEHSLEGSVTALVAELGDELLAQARRGQTLNR